MSDFAADLGRIIERVRGVPDAITRVMPKLAREVDAYLGECYARGVDPDGNPWPLTAAGEQAQITGASRTVTVDGDTIVVTLSGHDALHSLGEARGGVERRMLPANGIPPELAERLESIIVAELEATLEGGR